MTNLEKVLAVACWWAAIVALIVVFVRTVPDPVRRHARWALGYVVVATVIAMVVLIALAVVEAGEATLVVFAATAGMALLAGPIANTVAVLRNKGPFFRTLG